MIAETSLTGSEPFARAGTVANDTDKAPRSTSERYSSVTRTIAQRLPSVCSAETTKSMTSCRRLCRFIVAFPRFAPTRSKAGSRS